jgi:hypothetical protein
MSFAQHMPINALSKLINVSDDKLWETLDKYVTEARSTEDFSNVTTV